MDVVLDGLAIQTERDVHKALAKALDFGPHYGYNRAALWDVLSTDIERPFRVFWDNSEKSCDALGPTVFGELCALFGRVARDDIELGMIERAEFLLQ